jgi:hypothetical protein
MSDPMKQAWDGVADGFSTLGRMMKERYQGAGDDGEVPAADAATDADTNADDAFRQAFERLVTAGRELSARAGEVARDDEVRAQAKRAASSLTDALSATMNYLGEEVGGFFRRTKGDSDSTEIPTSEPPAEDARQ